jgi:hypothetical protein
MLKNDSHNPKRCHRRTSTQTYQAYLLENKALITKSPKCSRRPEEKSGSQHGTQYSPPQPSISSKSYDRRASSEPFYKGNDFSSLPHHSDKQHREKKIDVRDPNHNKKVLNQEFLNSLPLSLQIAQTTFPFLSFFNLKIRSRIKPNVSPFSAKKKTQA